MIPPSSTSRIQVDTIEQLDKVPVLDLDALGIVGGGQHLERACFQTFVPDAEPVMIPEQNLDAIAAAVEEQEEVTRSGILIEDLLNAAHQRIEAVGHLRGRGAYEDPQVSNVDHDCDGRAVSNCRST